MPKLPVISGDEFVHAMEQLGYSIDRIRGSHMILRAAGRPQLSVPRHRTLDRGTLRGLIRDAGLTVEDFLELLTQ
ncbi:MAG: type II toxin-antitoxin system HicA family toxin [Chloroflexi bacterium]|nr:type II toxin-antitoxin system HicA family toxin [Chloroflexota bacterium]